MRQNKNTWFYIGGSGLDRTDDFQKFLDQDWIGFNFIGSGLDSDWKISQSAHLCKQDLYKGGDAIQNVVGLERVQAHVRFR